MDRGSEIWIDFIALASNHVRRKATRKKNHSLIHFDYPVIIEVYALYTVYFIFIPRAQEGIL